MSVAQIKSCATLSFSFLPFVVQSTPTTNCSILILAPWVRMGKKSRINSNKKETNKFKFKKHAIIGASDAESDRRFLDSCFVNTGDLDTLADCLMPQRIVLGRTGTGKTALLYKFARENDAIVISPETLSFNYISNSTILKYLVTTGVNLDLFFKLLWRHIFCVELLKKKYNIYDESAQTSFFQRFNVFKRDKEKEKAVAYLRKYASKFFETTEYNVKEITTKFEEGLKGSLGSKVEVINAELGASQTLSSEEKTQVQQRAQTIINEIQMKELSGILDFLDKDVFGDSQQSYYICIDKLDENWIEDEFRYLLIRSLIETVREFNRVKNVKIIIAIRLDLLRRVFRETKVGGFQEEKYRSLYLPLKWNSEQLKELLDKRINSLIRESYTGAAVNTDKFLTATVGKAQPIYYMLDRTLMRPRELIEFFNLCLAQAEGRAQITSEMVIAAEGIYSKNRLQSLQEEWVVDYPRLLDFCWFLKKRHSQFKLKVFTQKDVEDFCTDYSLKTNSSDYLSAEAKKLANGEVTLEVFLQNLFHVFYTVGLIGLKIETYETLRWSYSEDSPISPTSINGETSVRIHPTFWRALGISPSDDI